MTQSPEMCVCVRGVCNSAVYCTEIKNFPLVSPERLIFKFSIARHCHNGQLLSTFGSMSEIEAPGIQSRVHKCI